jgi:N-acetylglucosaminyl-diphospho-decaprenol L-rhamnosyltransferase
MPALVHIVIVNWNTGDYLGECVESIVRADGPGVTIARVTVVDNASSDDSAERIGECSLPVELVRNHRNVGFAAACNQAAAGSTANYLLFLNPDARLLPDTLTAVTRFMEGDGAADVGICGVQVVDLAGHPTISCARFPTLRVILGEMTGLHLVLPRVFPRHQLTAEETSRSRAVDQVIGAFFFVRRDLFSRLGGFDERYFLYFEEVDFALRARRQGARSYFLREAGIVHAANVSTDQIRGARLYHYLRSRLLFAHEHWPRRQAGVLVALTLGVELTARVVRACWRRDGADLAAIAAAYDRLLGDLRRSGPALAGSGM